jgi:pimeloyl-ACP methyl ester carboxylesterase
MQYEIQRVTLPGRLTLQYVEHGDPRGVPVIALHGITDSWRSFEPLLPHLPRSLRVFALNQRGHGGGEAPTGYRTRDFADDVAAFIDALGLQRVVVAGHSMGSSNALRFAIDHPQRTLGLVLLGAFAAYRDKPELVDWWQTQVRPLSDPVGFEFAREFQQSTLAQPVSPAFFDTVMRECLKCPAHVWRGAFDGLFEDDFSAGLPTIAAPTLILWGRHDAFCPRRDQQALLAAIAGSRLVEYEHAGHALHWEEPARVAADIAAFVKQIETSR